MNEKIKQENQTYCLQWTPKSSILLSGIDWYSEGPSSGGLYPYHTTQALVIHDGSHRCCQSLMLYAKTATGSHFNDLTK